MRCSVHGHVLVVLGRGQLDMAGWLMALIAGRRFGKATRLQDEGAYGRALALFSINRRTLAKAKTASIPVLTLRLMNLIHLAEVASALRHPELARSSLEEWLTTWEAVRKETPSLDQVEALAKWETWVRNQLTTPT